VGGPDVELRLRIVEELTRDFEVIVLGNGTHPEALYARIGVGYRHYPMCRGINPLADLRSLASLFVQFRALRPDLVHTYDSKPSALGRLAAYLARVPVIAGTLPGMGSLYADNRLSTRLSRLPYQLSQTLACRLSDITIMQNAEDLKDMVDRGVVPRPRGMVIAGSGVDTEHFRPGISPGAAGRVRASLGVASSGLVVTMLSRVIRSKGVLEFAEAARRLRSAAPGARFLLVGASDAASRDRLTSAELESVRGSLLCGGARLDVADVLQVTDVFVLPSFYMEGVPRALLEAAACGLAIVTTDVRGCRDVIVDGVSGILVPPRDVEALQAAILSLLQDPAKRARFGNEARRRAVSDFDILKVAARTRDLYRRLLGEFAVAPQDRSSR
jgi:glycosyltransferase involved in cell wall biosynthesis